MAAVALAGTMHKMKGEPMGTMLDTIARIPEAVEAMARHREDRTEPLSRLLAALGPECCPERIVFVGSGSSYNSALAALPFCDRVGIEASALYPNQLSYRRTINKRDLYVFISQGGSTKLVFEGLEKVRAAGCPTCSITARLDAPIARAADASIEMGCGDEEYVYRTIGVSTSIVSCWQVAMALSAARDGLSDSELAALDEGLAAVAGSLDDIRERACAWFEDHRFSLLRKSYLMFAGANDLYAVAREADIKAMEMAPIITRSYELEEIIHGPQNAFDANGAFFIFAREAEDASKARSIAAFLDHEIGFCALVGDIAEGRRDFALTEADRTFGALAYLTFGQVLAYCYATARGRDLKRRVNATMDGYISKTL